MSRKNRKNIVYSTNPDFEYENDEYVEDETLPISEQKLVVSLDRKQRKGKVVTLVQGFVGSFSDLQTLARELKVACGVGGNAKDSDIVIQGDNKAKIVEILNKKGYKVR